MTNRIAVRGPTGNSAYSGPRSLVVKVGYDDGNRNTFDGPPDAR
jgi:hypothetical protein